MVGDGESILADTPLTSSPQEAGSKAHCMTSKGSKGTRMLSKESQDPSPPCDLSSPNSNLKDQMPSTPKPGLLIKRRQCVDSHPNSENLTHILILETVRGER